MAQTHCISCYRKFNHVHVVRYFGAGIDYDNLRCFVVMERADDSLKSLLDRRAMQMTETTERKNWTHGDQPTNEMQEHYELSKKAMLDVARGMEALHDVGVIHRDMYVHTFS
jgi:serine/threonine protein kinase